VAHSPASYQFAPARLKVQVLEGLHDSEKLKRGISIRSNLVRNEGERIG